MGKKELIAVNLLWLAAIVVGLHVIYAFFLGAWDESTLTSHVREIEYSSCIEKDGPSSLSFNDRDNYEFSVIIHKVNCKRLKELFLSKWVLGELITDEFNTIFGLSINQYKVLDYEVQLSELKATGMTMLIFAIFIISLASFKLKQNYSRKID